MTIDRLARAVREQVALGRILPLGGPADTAWITEQAAAGVLRTAAAGVSGVRLGALRVDWAEADAPPRTPLRVDAAFEATADRPLPATSDDLRHTLLDAAHDRLGLDVAAVDLTVTGLLDQTPEPEQQPETPETATPAAEPEANALTEAVRAVPGVARVTSRLGGFGQGPYVQIAVATGHRALDVARAVRDETGAPAVIVTDLD